LPNTGGAAVVAGLAGAPVPAAAVADDWGSVPVPGVVAPLGDLVPAVEGVFATAAVADGVDVASSSSLHAATRTTTAAVTAHQRLAIRLIRSLG
jgi:hypothetical protein